MKLRFSAQSIKNHDNFFYLKLFLYILLILIFLSLVYKSIRLWQGRQYLGDSFKMLIVARDAYLINIDQKNASVSVGIWKNSGSNLASHTKLENSLTLHAPINGEIIQNSRDSYSNLTFSYFSLANMFHIIFHSHDFQYKGMNILDMFKIYFATKGISSSNIQEVVVDKNTKPESIYNLYKDAPIINEKTSVEVINATDTNGLGTDMAQMLENGGFNVVSIKSQDPDPKSKIVYRIAPNTSLRHLFQIFPFPTSYRAETAIADVTVIVGQDALKRK